MTDKQTPPDWVIHRAATMTNKLPSYLREVYPASVSTRALCDMIERYEQPPQDRKLLCAREADREWSEAGCTAHWETALVRAIELWESGYGA